MYRVISNDALKHLQWIVVRDDRLGRPLMVAGPFADEHTALMHCEAHNEANSKSHITTLWRSWFRRGFAALPPATALARRFH